MSRLVPLILFLIAGCSENQTVRLLALGSGGEATIAQFKSLGADVRDDGDTTTAMTDYKTGCELLHRLDPELVVRALK